MVNNAVLDQSGGPASRACQHVQILSTDNTPARERFAYWREGVRHLFGVAADAPQNRDFSARAVVRSTGPFRFLVSESTGFHAAWSREYLTHAYSDHFSVYLQLGGQTIAARGEQTIQLNAGDIGFCDGRRQLRAWFGGRCAIASVPRAMVERRAPWLRHRPHSKLAPNARFAGNLRLHMMELTSGDLSLSEGETGLLADSLCNLVALAAAEGIPSRRLQGELQIEALLAFCRQNLGDADLSPQRAADHLGISVRTLHSRFRGIGQSFGRWLLENRLEGCSVALRDANQRTLNISEIAWRWGFNDLSYFNKAFRAQFDMTPGEWRQDVKVS
jgi:AraC family transcriptional regulator, positive regulator of tynA and feaB